MYFVIMLLVCLVCIIGCIFFGALALAGATYLNQRIFGDSDDADAFDFTQHDDRQRQEFILRCALVAAIPAATALLLGFLLGGTVRFFRPHYHVLGLLLLILYAGAAFAANSQFGRLDPKRAGVATAAMCLIFIILNWWFFLPYMT